MIFLIIVFLGILAYKMLDRYLEYKEKMMEEE